MRASTSSPPGGMLAHAHAVEQGEGDGHGAGAGGPREAVVATEVGMLYPLQMAAPQVRFIPANAEASCRFMKMITLPKLRDSLAHMRYEVRVPEDLAERARVPIDRMVAIGAAARRRQEARAHPGRCRPSHDRAQALQPHTRTHRRCAQDGRLGVLPRRDRRLQPTGLCRGAQRTSGRRRRSASCAGRVRFFADHGVARRARA